MRFQVSFEYVLALLCMEIFKLAPIHKSGVYRIAGMALYRKLAKRKQRTETPKWVYPLYSLLHKYVNGSKKFAMVSSVLEGQTGMHHNPSWNIFGIMLVIFCVCTANWINHVRRVGLRYGSWAFRIVIGFGYNFRLVFCSLEFTHKAEISRIFFTCAYSSTSQVQLHYVLFFLHGIVYNRILSEYVLHHCKK